MIEEKTREREREKHNITTTTTVFHPEVWGFYIEVVTYSKLNPIVSGLEWNIQLLLLRSSYSYFRITQQVHQAPATLKWALGQAFNSPILGKSILSGELPTATPSTWIAFFRYSTACQAGERMVSKQVGGPRRTRKSAQRRRSNVVEVSCIPLQSRGEG